MKLRADEEYQRILKEADSKATQIQEKAHRKASGKRGRSAKRR
jgi:vacuolar-type H+-ATPase subunit H